MAIIGSQEWILKRGSADVRNELITWLRFALTVGPDMQLVVKRDAHNFDVADVVLSRCEVSLAFIRLPKRFRWVLWDVVVKRRPLYEVAMANGLSIDTVRRYVDQGLRMMELRIYEKLKEVA